MSIYFTNDEIQELAETVVLEHLSQELEFLTTVEIVGDEHIPTPTVEAYDELLDEVHLKAESILSELAAHHAQNGF